jgi:hypothetical protein
MREAPKHRPGLGPPRYFLVGNNVDGIQGIEMDIGVDLGLDPECGATWQDNHLTPQECKRILRERYQ